MKQKSLTKYSVLVLLLMLYSLTSCTSLKSPKPIPENKKAFIGMWISQTGFKMDIKPSGTADLTQNNNSSNPDDIKLKGVDIILRTFSYINGHQDGEKIIPTICFYISS